jgi:hypothetical protein
MLRASLLISLLAGCSAPTVSGQLILNLQIDDTVSDGDVASITQVDVTLDGASPPSAHFDTGFSARMAQVTLDGVSASGSFSIVATAGSSAQTVASGRADGATINAAMPTTINLTLTGGGVMMMPDMAMGASLQLAPASVTLSLNMQQYFAVLSGNAVDWTVQEAGGGSIDSTGLYTAPATTGTFHVVATSQADASLKGSATVIVSAEILDVYSGALGGRGSADGPGTQARFANPDGIATDSVGNVYVADSLNFAIRKIDTSTAANTVSTIAGALGQPGTTDGTGSGARFLELAGLAYDGGQNLYVCDRNRIRKIVIATGVVTTVTGQLLQGSKDGTPDVASLYRPNGIAATATTLYIADTHNDIIRQLNLASGVLSLLAGGGLTGTRSGFKDGVLTGTTSALFRGPTGVTYDAANNRIFVTDNNNNRIRLIDVTGASVTTVAGGGTNIGDAVGTAARLLDPWGIAYQGGTVYFAENAGRRIRTVAVGTPAMPGTNQVTTIAGGMGIGYADGTGTAALFNRPHDLALDGVGNLFITDYFASTVRQLR